MSMNGKPTNELNPTSHVRTNAPVDDEPETEYDRNAVAEARDWLRTNPEGIPFEDILADFELTIGDLRDDPVT